MVTSDLPERPNRRILAEGIWDRAGRVSRPRKHYRKRASNFSLHWYVSRPMVKALLLISKSSSYVCAVTTRGNPLGRPCFVWMLCTGQVRKSNKVTMMKVDCLVYRIKRIICLSRTVIFTKRTGNLKVRYFEMPVLYKGMKFIKKGMKFIKK